MSLYMSFEKMTNSVETFHDVTVGMLPVILVVA